jgi:hypothetical protein
MLRKIEIIICDKCLNGIGEECHTPGCALYLHRVDLPVDKRLYKIIESYKEKKMEYDPENAFEKNKCNKCDGNRGVCEISGCYESCYIEYLEQQNKQILNALVMVVEEKWRKDSPGEVRIKELIESITGKKIEEVLG